jgi:hypothetical protein
VPGGVERRYVTGALYRHKGMLRRRGHAVTRSPKGQGTNVLHYCRNLTKKPRGAACQMPGVNNRLGDSVVLGPGHDTHPLQGEDGVRR